MIRTTSKSNPMFPDDKDHTHDTPDETPEDLTQSSSFNSVLDRIPVEETPAPEESEAVAAAPVAADAEPVSSPIPHPPAPAAQQENLVTLETSIRALDAGHIENGKRNYKSFWDAAKLVGALFKTLRPLPYDDRERLWMEFSALCDDVRAQQTHEKEELKFSSHELRAELEAKIAAVREQAQAATKATEFNTVTSELAKIRNDFTAKQGVEPNMLARDREALWKIWKAADDEVWSRRTTLRKENYEQGRIYCAQFLEMAEQGDPIECHKKIKELRPWQRDVELSREQREEIRKQLDLAWDKAAARIQEQRADRQKHFEEWSEKAEGLLEEWQNKIEKMREFRGRLLEQIERLNEMEANARTDEFADQVAGWKTDKQQKLDHVADTIAQLEQKIESVKKRLKK
ncbi:hypothetical protein IT157_01590 [bacterium]|nr:hypothetical protein [bacterium]